MKPSLPTCLILAAEGINPAVRPERRWDPEPGNGQCGEGMVTGDLQLQSATRVKHYFTNVEAESGFKIISKAVLSVKRIPN